MSKDDRVSRDTDSPDVALPGTANRVARDRPALWEAFQRLGEEASRAGPLDDRTRRLVHLAYAIAADSEGATHSHARRALGDGIGVEELEHVALLAVTTIGWSGAIKGLSWVRDVTAGRRRVMSGVDWYVEGRFIRELQLLVRVPLPVRGVAHARQLPRLRGGENRQRAFRRRETRWAHVRHPLRVARSHIRRQGRDAGHHR